MINIAKFCQNTTLRWKIFGYFISIAYFCKKVMITIEEVNKFLDEFKVKAKVFGIIYRDDRRKNSDALIQLGISAHIRERIIFSLDGEDYSQGPIMETLNGGAEMWVFGKDHNDIEIYIKISVAERSLCISFHEAERPMQYPFRKEE